MKCRDTQTLGVVGAAMIRSVAFGITACLLIQSPQAVFATESLAKPECKVDAVGDSMEVKCPLAAAATPTRYSFTAHFSGGHDDTHAWLTAKMNDAPLVCSEGSKTDLEGEEGEVSLLCLF